MTPNEIADALEGMELLSDFTVEEMKVIAAAIAHLRAPAALPELPPLLEPTPMEEHPLGGQVEAFRMDAYYYGFAATGIKAIDLILSAVACAGKSFHHTEQWNEDCGEPYHDLQRGKTPVEWIQNAADDAAAAIRAYALAALAGNASQHPDDVAVDRFAAAMKAKMAASRAKGRGGWEDPEQCPIERLQAMMTDHMVKGDPVDVGNFAMMLFNRGAATALAGRGQDAWQPIATAPKDRRVLVWSGQEQYCADWAKHPITDDEAWIVAEFGTEGDQVLVKPTHWMPLPKAPAAIAASAG